MIDQDRVIDMLTGLAELLGVEVSTERLIGYVAALQDLSEAQIAHACRLAARDCVFFPKPGELRGYVVVGAPARHPVTVWPEGWRQHCPHGTCVVPTQCLDAWAWVKATVLAEEAAGATA